MEKPVMYCSSRLLMRKIRIQLYSSYDSETAVKSFAPETDGLKYFKNCLIIDSSDRPDYGVL